MVFLLLLFICQLAFNLFQQQLHISIRFYNKSTGCNSNSFFFFQQTKDCSAILRSNLINFTTFIYFSSANYVLQDILQCFQKVYFHVAKIYS